MTERESEIFHIIQQNPAISQNELAAKLNLARSSVAVHIANLQKKGYILGKGYIVNESAYVLGVGAANVDIHGRSKKSIVMHDSNPGHMNTSAGGVTRNVCENLSRLGVSVKLISAVGTVSANACATIRTRIGRKHKPCIPTLKHFIYSFCLL